jgi:hypothetical protein
VVAEKRRLPVFKPTPEEESGEPPRPPWHWVGFGTAATYAAWLPLAYAAEAVRRRLFAAYLGPTSTVEEVALALDRLTPAERTKLTVLAVLVPILPLAVASFFGGFLVGRWGGAQATVRMAALAGVATGVVGCLLAWASAGLAWTPLLAVAVATPMSAWGGRVGIGRRRRATGA